MLKLKYNAFCYCVFFCALLYSCNIISFEDFEISGNIEGYDQYFSEDYVRLSFSLAPEHHSIENLVNLKRGGQTVDAEKTWNGNELYLKEKYGWEKGQRYELNIKGNVTVNGGGIYPCVFIRYFYYGESGNVLYVICSEPADGGVIGADGKINIAFNKEIDYASFMDKFKISPSTSYKLIFQDDKKSLDIINAENWKLNTTYTIEFSGVISNDGYILDMPFSMKFSTTDDNKLPELITVCPVMKDGDSYIFKENQGIEGQLYEDNAIGIVFSKPMNIFSVKSSVSFDPSLKGSVEAASDNDKTRFVFAPYEYYSIGTRYCLSISDSVKDESGFGIKESKSIFFTSINNHLKVNSIGFENADSITDFSVKDKIYERAVTDNSGVKTMEIVFNFSSAIEDTEKNKVLNYVSLAPLFPSSGAYPVLYYAEWDTSNNSELITKWENWTVSNGGVDYYYKLTIKGGKDAIKNGRGEYMEDDICVIIKTISE